MAEENILDKILFELFCDGIDEIPWVIGKIKDWINEENFQRKLNATLEKYAGGEEALINDLKAFIKVDSVPEKKKEKIERKIRNIEQSGRNIRLSSEEYIKFFSIRTAENITETFVSYKNGKNEALTDESKKAFYQYILFVREAVINSYQSLLSDDSKVLIMTLNHMFEEYGSQSNIRNEFRQTFLTDSVSPPQKCFYCGGEEFTKHDGVYFCDHCHKKNYPVKPDALEEFNKSLSVVLSDTLHTMQESINAIMNRLDGDNQAKINYARTNLHYAVNSHYIGRKAVRYWALELKKCSLNDFEANFYIDFLKSIDKPDEVVRNIDNIEVNEHYECLERLIVFVIKSLKSKYFDSIKNLIERAYRDRDDEKYQRYSTMLDEESDKCRRGDYIIGKRRDVFVSYSIEDRDNAIELVEHLERKGISCFIATRNIQRGVGSKENYIDNVKKAMDNCTIFVFVSSMNSRNSECPALEWEFGYIKEQDKNNAPGQYRNYYARIPKEYKKPRVEYRIQESIGENFADELVDEFFSGYERTYTADDVAKRVLRQSVGVDGYFSESNAAADNYTQTHHNEKKAPAIIPSDERNKRGRTIGILSVVAIILILTILFVWVVPLVRNNHSDNSNNNNNNTESINGVNKDTNSDDYTDKNTDDNNTTEDTTDKSYSRVGEKITFGSYPHTKVTDDTLTETLNGMSGTLPTSSNSQAWTSYGYYISGNVENFMWYIDVEEGSEKYRGVYFTSYRPYYAAYSPSSGDIYQHDNGYETGVVYWFKYEPISWTILSENTTEETALILCDMIIDSQEYYITNSGTRTIDGKTVYPNNYAESTIRKWLNETFYNTAFSELQKQIILTTMVDNSATTTNALTNLYACENTEDKIFLLSYKDIINSNYGFSASNSAYDTVRQKKSTDYAQAQGQYTSTSSSYAGNGGWWLRSPNSDSSGHAHVVDGHGDASYYNYVPYTNIGVVPALQINVHEKEHIHADNANDGDHKCDYCKTTITSCADDDKDHDCDECGIIISDHIYKNGYCALCSENEPQYTRDGNKIIFGSYPQSKVTDGSLRDTLNLKAGALPTSQDSYKWISYGYYMKNQIINFMWYIDIEEGGERYRGVYFTAYRPGVTSLDNSKPEYFHQFENEYYSDIVYWFKYDPISWTIVSEDTSNGTAMIFADIILDSQAYQNTHSDSDSDGKYYNNNSDVPEGIYANNYEYSTIRTWLNETFYNTAFSELQQEIILTTTVDNSARSVGGVINEYICNNTEDKVFLLSYSEVQIINSKFGVSALVLQPTDYAISQGAWVDSTEAYYGNGFWWLRSPATGDKTLQGISRTPYAVGRDGSPCTIEEVRCCDNGIVPAIQIKL